MINFISGVMLGVELVEDEDNSKFLVLDLLILRIVFLL